MSAAGAPPRQRIDPGALADRLAARLERWRRQEYGRRLWRRDPALWSDRPVPEITDRLGWLDLPRSMAAEVPGISAFAADAAADGLDQVVVCGMGGSSLVAETFRDTLAPGASVRVADSTHPTAVRELSAALDPSRALFLIASKSGTTVESLALWRFFGAWAERRMARPGRHFAAITDPDTPLATLAAERGFRHVFLAPPDVGGRFSALTPFGLVPAALAGADPERLLDAAGAMADACGPEVDPADSPGLALGALLGEAALSGADRLRLAAPALPSFFGWVEQLVAESTGKGGAGILPLAAEPAAAAGPPERAVEVRIERPEGPPAGVAAGPAVAIRVGDPYELGAELLRWQVATAAASSVLGVHPFNQPDVQLAKEITARAVREGGAADAPRPLAGSEVGALRRWLEGVPASGYLGLQAYLDPSPGTARRLEALRVALGAATGAAVTAGWGPRYLHSTGQLHKGGPDGGWFVQLLDRPGEDVEIPDGDTTFGRLLRAQADGDAAALTRRGRTVLRLDLGAEPLAALEAIAAALGG